jgi:hypothetical protein
VLGNSTTRCGNNDRYATRVRDKLAADREHISEKLKVGAMFALRVR